ncbi:hypothetical protein EJP77_00275 [Paenibacillus zeisoli]|uniref:DUF3221 domain-containing protein n=1 Tax=Paenibacillus zeisoli TaxID=2496267 RepID=A0A3S1DC99_9BACL|nr:hypothetical protein [Paenibacillus zeisoli]RUT35502.1 hypothetical protein EJP77_00275 [Paenibacillus zeisoli]
MIAKKSLMWLPSLMLTMAMTACGSTTTIKTENGTAEVKKDGSEFTVNSKDGETTTFKSQDDNTFQIESNKNDGSGGKTTVKSSTEIPASFPKDIPLPDDAKTTGSIETNADGKESIIVTIHTDKELSELETMYKQYFKDNNVSNSMQMVQSGAILFSGELEGHMISISGSPSGDAAEGMDLSISWTENEAK